MKQTYSFDTPHDYIVADIDGQKCLVDTGCPLTFGHGTFQFPGGPQVALPCDMFLQRSIESLGQDIGTHLDFLIGTDILSRYPFVIDWDAKTLTFNLDGNINGGDVVPMRPTFSGHIGVDFKINGRQVKGVIDTGCPVVLGEPVPDRGQPTGRFDDFEPTGGRFSTDLYDGQIQLGPRVFPGKLATPPAGGLEMISKFLGGYLLGADLWKAGPVGFDIKRQKLHLFSRN